jgi:multidrug efflux system membrane fusion protein
MNTIMTPSTRGQRRFRCVAWPVFFAIGTSALAGGCHRQPGPPAPVPVKVKVLEPESIVVSRRFSASVEPLQTTLLAFKLEGTVRSLYRPPNQNRDVQVGDTLAKGTVIAELDEGDLRRAKAGVEAKVAQLEARVATAKDSLEIATRNYERFAGSSGSVSQAAKDDARSRQVIASGELAAAKNALAEAHIALDQAQDNYVNRQLIVPFENATVAEKKVEPGERVAARTTVFRLIDISTVHVTFGVPDTMVGEPAMAASPVQTVHLGQKLEITADAFEGRSFTGTVTKIAPQADPKTRTFLTELSLPNPIGSHGQPLLRPGMIVSVRLGTENDRRVMLLPMSAIHPGLRPEELTVYEVVTEGGRDVVRTRKVALGGIYNNAVEVLPDTSEVQPGARVVLTTTELLSDGAAVRVIQDTTAPATTRPEAI